MLIESYFLIFFVVPPSRLVTCGDLIHGLVPLAKWLNQLLSAFLFRDSEVPHEVLYHR